MGKEISREVREDGIYAKVETKTGQVVTVKYDSPTSTRGVIVEAPPSGYAPPATIGPARKPGEKFHPDEDVDWEPAESQADPAKVTYNLRGRKTGQVVGQATTRKPGVYSSGRDPGEGRTSGWVGRKTEVVKDPSRKDYGRLESGLAALTEPLDLIGAFGSEQDKTEVAANLAAGEATKKANQWTSAAVEYGPALIAPVKALGQKALNKGIREAVSAKAAGDLARSQTEKMYANRVLAARGQANTEYAEGLSKWGKTVGEADASAAVPPPAAAIDKAQMRRWGPSKDIGFNIPEAERKAASLKAQIKALDDDIVGGNLGAIREAKVLREQLFDVEKSVREMKFDYPSNMDRADLASDRVVREQEKISAKTAALRGTAKRELHAAKIGRMADEGKIKVLRDEGKEASEQAFRAGIERDLLAGTTKKKGLVGKVGAAAGALGIGSMLPPTYGAISTIRNVLGSAIGSQAKVGGLSDKAILKIIEHAKMKPKSSLGTLLRYTAASPGAYSEALKSISPNKDYAETLIGEEIVQLLEEEE